MADFTVHKYSQLLKVLIEKDYNFQSFEEYLTNPLKRSIVSRHDVDDRPQNSLTLAKIESGLGMKGTYNFRIVPCSWDEVIIKEIASLGHEIGYHYEDLALCKGDFERAFNSFKENLEKLRDLVPVNTITMHGSPTSRYDSRDLWKHYDYKDLGLIGEPYFDVDFSKVLYLTDTGRKWDGSKVSIRDRVNPDKNNELIHKGYQIHSTDDIIKAANENALPDTIMFTVHPQRWHNNNLLWVQELVMQNIKNVVKRILRGLGR